MPKDNHSLMQLYLDGNKNCFFTFFDVIDANSPKIKNKILDNFKYLKGHSLQSIKLAQKQATQIVFKSKKFLLEVLKYLKKTKKHLVSYLHFSC